MREKKEKLQEAIGFIGDDLIKEAENPTKVMEFNWRSRRTLIAAVLVVVLVATAMIYPHRYRLFYGQYTIAAAEYPETKDYAGYSEYYEHLQERTRDYENAISGWEDFFSSSVQKFIGETNDGNMVFSPINVYIALSMLAEITDGESRGQILDALGAENVESLRDDISKIWEANYSDVDDRSCILANSLWLNESINYEQTTLDILADRYYVSSFYGEMGSWGYSKALQSWLNEQTKSLLKEQNSSLEMAKETVLMLASTVYFDAEWIDEFEEDDNTSKIFHGANGDVECEFMNKSDVSQYYWGKKFSATSKKFDDNGHMLLILPDKGVDVEELLSDAEAMELILSSDQWENSQMATVNLSLPKFDITSQIDLTEGLKELGVTDIFDFETSDFSPLTDDDRIKVTGAKHDVRVMIDEDGCQAVAQTIITGDTGAPEAGEDIDFILDRPFIFAIISDVGTPLFVGVVNQPK